MIYSLPASMSREVYESLVTGLLDQEEWFGLVWRSTPKASAISSGLAPLEFERRRTDRWPGTQLIGHQATVVRYRASPEALPHLLSVNSLYDWFGSDLPEDLFFGSNSWQLALVSVAHEREAWLLKRRSASLLGQKITLTRESYSDRDMNLIKGLGTRD